MVFFLWLFLHLPRTVTYVWTSSTVWFLTTIAFILFILSKSPENRNALFLFIIIISLPERCLENSRHSKYLVKELISIPDVVAFAPTLLLSQLSCFKISDGLIKASEAFSALFHFLSRDKINELWCYYHKITTESTMV